MKIRLQSTRAIAKSDGGVSLRVDSSSCSYPVLSLEASLFFCDSNDQAKRKKHRLRDSETTYQMHAAQIYAEMLGQVCHQRLYTSNPDGYQEVHSLQVDSY